MTKRSRRKKAAVRSTAATRRMPPLRVQLALSLAVSFVAVTLYWLIDGLGLAPKTEAINWYAIGTSGTVLLLGLILQPRLHQMYFRWEDKRAAERAAQARPTPVAPSPPPPPPAPPTRRKRR